MTNIIQPGFGLGALPSTAPTAFVEPAHYAATDTSNPLGTPAKPRKTLPPVLPAGTVVLVTGAVYQPANATVTAQGSLSAPCTLLGNNAWVVGNGTGRTLTLTGGFLYAEGVNILGLQTLVTGSAIALRKLQVAGTDTSAVALLGAGNVISQCAIHHNGQSNSATEDDDHGVLVGPGAQWSWVLDSEIGSNGGDAIQVGQAGSANPFARFVFIARTKMSGDRENAVDIKRAADVIVADCTMRGYAPTSSSAGEAMVIHNGATRVWAIRNAISESTKGIVCTSGNGIFAVENTLTGFSASLGSATLYGPHPITLYGTALGWAVNNVTDGAITLPTGTSYDLAGNVGDIRLGDGVVPVSMVGNLPCGSEAVKVAHPVYDLYQQLYGVAL